MSDMPVPDIGSEWLGPDGVAIITENFLVCGVDWVSYQHKDVVNPETFEMSLQNFYDMFSRIK